MNKSQAFTERSGDLPKAESEDLADSILAGENQKIPYLFQAAATKSGVGLKHARRIVI